MGLKCWEWGHSIYGGRLDDERYDNFSENIEDRIIEEIHIRLDEIIRIIYNI